MTEMAAILLTSFQVVACTPLGWGLTGGVRFYG